MFAVFHSSGKVPCCTEHCNIKVKIGTISFEDLLRKYAGIPSGTVALWEFISCNKLVTLLTEIKIWDISGQGESLNTDNDLKPSWV